MKKETFITKLYNLIAKENISIYNDLFDNSNINDIKDDYWKSAINLYNKLSTKDKQTLIEIIKQISIDTASNILAIIDGVTYLENQDDDINLSFETKKEKINGDLQDLFLEIVEDNN